MTSPVKPYSRVILKISGESFARVGEAGIDPSQLAHIAKEIVAAAQGGTQIAVVVGGGNMVRGTDLAKQGDVDRHTAGYVGVRAPGSQGRAPAGGSGDAGKDSGP